MLTQQTIDQLTAMLPEITAEEELRWQEFAKVQTQPPSPERTALLERWLPLYELKRNIVTLTNEVKNGN